MSTTRQKVKITTNVNSAQNKPVTIEVAADIKADGTIAVSKAQKKV